MKHTPGPWTMEPNEDSDMEWEVNADDGMYIADIIGGYDLEQVTADARLIAESPELLEACIRAEAYLERIVQLEVKAAAPILQGTIEVHAGLKATIARATIKD